MTTDVESPGDGFVTIRVGSVAAIAVSAIVVITATLFASRLLQVVGLVLAAISMAVITLPVQRWLRRVVGHGLAVALTAAATATTTLLLAAVAVRDLSGRVERFSELVQRRLDEIRAGSLIDRIVTATRLNDAIDGWLEQVPSRVFLGGESGSEIAAQLFMFLTVVVLAAFLQSSGAALLDRFVGRWPRGEGDDPGSRRELRDLLDDVERRGVGAVRRTLALVLAVAVAVGMVGTVIDFPGAVVLGLWVGAWAAAPTIGGGVALIPVALLALLDQRPVAWIVVGTAVAGVVAAAWARRRWIDRLVRIGPGPYVLALAAGAAAAGVGGTVVALLATTVVVAVLSSQYAVGRPTPWRVPADRSWQLGGLSLPTGWRLLVLCASTASVAVIAWFGLLRLGRAAVWVLVGGFLAVALSRPVSWLTRRARLSRRSAALLVGAVVVAAIAGAGLTGADEGARATTTLTERLPSIVAGLEEVPVVGGWLESRGAAPWVEAQMNDLPQRVRTGRPADWLPFFGDRLVDAFWVAVLTAALLLDGPRIADGLTRLVPARHRRQWERLLVAITAALGGYAAGAAIVATINASVIFVVAVLLGLGVAPALALWGFLWNFVPQIGGFMGGLPLVVFALVLGPLRGLFAAVVFISYQFLENHLIQPAVVGAAIDVPPWGTLLAAVAGAAAAGVVGAIVLTPLVGVVGVVRRELARDDFPGAVVASTRPVSAIDP